MSLKDFLGCSAVTLVVFIFVAGCSPTFAYRLCVDARDAYRGVRGAARWVIRKCRR